MIFKKISFCLVALLLFACTEDDPIPDPKPNPGPNLRPDPRPEITEVNKWILDYMNEKYLWNEAVAKVTPDSAKYNQFLLNILNRVAAQNNVNKDDGVWVDGKRIGYYSHILETPAKTKSEKSSYTDHDFGIFTGLVNIDSNENGVTHVMHVMGVII